MRKLRENVEAALVALAAAAAILLSSGPTHVGAQEYSAPITASQVALITSQEEALVAERGGPYRYLVVRDAFHNHLEALREAHPEAEIIIYKNVGFILKAPGCPHDPYQGSGASWCDANENEDLFLHSNSGERLEADASYPNQWAMNIANPEYRQLWLDTVLERLRDAHNDGSGAEYDGVWMDDLNLFPGHELNGRIAELTDGQYREAAQDFAEEVGPALEAEGFTSIANVGMDPWEVEQRESLIDMADDVGAINREGFVRWGDDGMLFTAPSGPAPFWEYELELMEDIQAAGGNFHAVTYGKRKRLRAQRYARGTFLLGWDGQDGSAHAFRSTSNGRTYLPRATTDVGAPMGERYRSRGVWRRDYAEGTVLVNARPNRARTVRLQQRFKRPSGTCAGKVRVPARGAMILSDC